MKRMVNKLRRDERGQALIIVAILMLVGALIITPLLGYMGTGLIVGQVFEEKMDGLYAADAGVEDALWKIINEPPASYPYPYPDPLIVNGMSVNVTIEEVTTLFGEELGGGVHYWIIDLESELIDDPSDLDYRGDYTYRLVLTNKHNKNVGVEEIKITFSTNLDYSEISPPDEGYYYVDGLYDGDVVGVELLMGSFTHGSLTVTVSESGDSQILTWEFPEGDTKIDGNPFADPSDPESWVTVSCIFQLVGFDDAPEISNFVLVGVSKDIGAVWELKPLRITATAQAEDGSTVVVEAVILESSDAVIVGSWQIE